MTSSINRRAAMVGALVSSAALAAPIDASTAAANQLGDPLVEAIAAYRAGCKAYNELPDEVSDAPGDPAVAYTYGPPIERLASWSSPALSREAAFEALKVVEEEVQFLSDLGEAMFDAVLEYLRADLSATTAVRA